MRRLLNAGGLAVWFAFAAYSGFSVASKDAAATNCYHCGYNDATALWYCQGGVDEGYTGCRLHGNPAGSLGCDHEGFFACLP
jgi:hypothetical protein